MLALMRLINELSPADPSLCGEPVSVDELARRLGIKPVEVRRDIDLLNVCSETLPGYFVDYDDQRDEVTPLRMDMAIDRTIGLTPREAMALLTALDAMGFDRGDPLVETLSQALPPLTSERIHGIEMQTSTSGLGDTLGTLSQALAEHRVVHLRYQNASDSSPRERDVEPQGLSYDLEESAWYLSAWCRMARGWRTFRLDRMDSAELREERFSPRLGNVGDSQGNEPSSIDGFLKHALVATLAVHEPARVGDDAPETWRELRHASDDSKPDAKSETESAVALAWAALTGEERENGAFVATIPWVKDQPWLARMVAATFGGVEVVDPPELRAQVSETALKLLDELE